MFCPKCGSILIPKKEKDKTVFICSCGYRSKDEGDGRIREAAKKSLGAKMDIVDSEADLKAMPKMKVECPKCHNSEAYFWEVQTRAADEPATKFLKCTKCKHTWRDYN
ncbi:transcription factor S [Candidatus Woesearchaeota archaeon]|nr:transcription factor S [Candidatus Woesearchaeota archaeon]